MAKEGLNPAFGQVKKEVEMMKGDLKTQKKDESKQRDECIAELRKLDKDMTATENDRADLTTSIATAKDSLASLADNVKALKAGISEMRVQVKKASEDRELENKDFQATVTDQ